MIFVGNIRELRPGMFDSAYAIMRFYKPSGTGWIQHLPVLSPDVALFRTFRQLQAEGKWNEAAFQNIYVPRFLKQMASDPAAVHALNDLFLRSKYGERIGLCCTCVNENACHRSIIAGMLQGAGAEVRLASGADFSAYFGQYKTVERQVSAHA